MSVFDLKILAPLAVMACMAVAGWIYLQREYAEYLKIARA